MKSSALTLFFELAGPSQVPQRIGIGSVAQSTRVPNTLRSAVNIRQRGMLVNTIVVSCRYLRERLTQPPELIFCDFLGEHGD
jgi:hypothetical protein